MRWLYQREISAGTLSGDHSDAADETKVTKRDMVVETYIFGDMILDLPFQDAVIDALVMALGIPVERLLPCIKTGIQTDTIKRVYKFTVSYSPLWKLIMDAVIFQERSGKEKLSDPSCPEEFVRDLNRRAVALQKKY